VGGIRLELQDTRPNFAVLRLLASRTGGAFLLPEDLGQFDSLLFTQGSFARREIHRTRDVELWSWSVILAAVIFLFAAEWVLRRRAGLL
jgi:hypothetical protein